MFGLLRLLVKQFVMYAAEGEGGGDATPQVDAASARTFLTDFGHNAENLGKMPDADVLKLHGTVNASIGKHYKAPAPKAGDEWYGSFQDPAVKEWLKAYGPAYPNAESVAMKALNLEKFIGAEKAGRGVVIPKSDAKPEEWKAFFSKLGAPAKPDGYALTDEQKKDPMLVGFRERAHALGMPPMIYNGIMEWVGEAVKKMDAEDVAAFEKNAEKELQEVTDEWGTEYNAKAAQMQRAARTFLPNMTPEERMQTLNKMEGALGTKNMMHFWQRIGAAMGEHGFVDGGNQGGLGMTKEAALARIDVLKNDKEWGKKLIEGDAAAKTEWDNLHIIAHGAAQAS